MTTRKRVAVFFGGRSPEHDVSIVTGLQVLDAVDSARFDPFPVYVAPDGEWLVGDALRDQGNYMLKPATRQRLMSVTMDVAPTGRGVLLPRKTGSIFGAAKPVSFDIALPAFHGLVGEDGPFQGLMEVAGVPYTGMRTKASAIFMDKATTKTVFADGAVPMLPYVAIHRPGQGLLIDSGMLQSILKTISFPLCIKPAHLGSSIGVGKANNIEEARAILSTIFRYDSKAIAEPYVQNLIEYNIAVRQGPDGRIETSAIERPKTSAELLDFKQKYLSGPGKGGKKAPGTTSQGMLSLTRAINPNIPEGMEEDIRTWAEIIFTRLDGTGAPRIDFISNRETGEVWFNELNPCPGSFGFFLWNAAAKPVLFTDLLTDLLDEAGAELEKLRIDGDPTPADARLFARQ